MFHAHSTAGQLSFHTRLAFSLRFLQKTVQYHRLHRKTKLITANIRPIYPSVRLYTENGWKHRLQFFFFKVTWWRKSTNVFTPRFRKCGFKIKSITPHLSRLKESMFTHKYQDKPLCRQNVHLLLQQVVEGTWP